MFVVLTLCLQMPVFENYYLCLGYIVLCFYIHKSIIISISVGCLGVIIYCILTNGLRGMLGWAIGNIVISIVVGCFLGIVIVKSFIEYLLFLEPMVLRIMKNMYAFIADIIMMGVGMIVYEKLKHYINL